MNRIREKLKKKKTFIKYLISYMLVFLLPILLILFHFYPETTKIIKKEAQNSEAVLLSQINSYVSIQVNSILNCATTIHSNRDITSNMFFQNNEFNTFLIMQEMKKIVGTNSFIERAFLYSASNHKFYSHTGTINEDEFGRIGSSFYYESWMQDDILMKLKQTTDLMIRPSERVILPYGNNSPYSVLIIVVKEESFFSFMKNEFETHNGNILILNSNHIPVSAIILKRKRMRIFLYIWKEFESGMRRNFSKEIFPLTMLL